MTHIQNASTASKSTFIMLTLYYAVQHTTGQSIHQGYN